MKWLAVLAIVIAVSLLGWGACLYRTEVRPVPPVNVESPERDLGERPVGTSEVVFRVTNPSDHPAEVVSTPEGCGRQCCLKAVDPGRKVIPPGGSVDLVCELTVVAEGPFDISGPLYLNDNGLRTVKLTVRGVGIAARGTTDATPKR